MSWVKSENYKEKKPLDISQNVMNNAYMVDFCHYKLPSNAKYYSLKRDQIEMLTANISRGAKKGFIAFIIYQFWLERCSSLVMLNMFPNKDSLTSSIGVEVEDKYIRNTH